MQDIIGVISIFFSVVVLLSLVKTVQKFLDLSAEVTRKIVHIMMGITISLFPWIFSSSTAVWSLAILVIFLFISIRFIKFLAPLGAPLYSIERISFGEIYFTLGVALTFEYASSDLFFVLSILILTFSDSFAAIIGVRYGTYNITFFQSKRSLEGTSTFFILSFVILAIGLSLLGIFSLIHIFITAAVFALIITLVEVFSIFGLDNLTIPLSALALLELAL